MADPNSSMPIDTHLKELRGALIRSLLVLFAACVISFYFSDVTLRWLMRPLSAKVVFLSPAEVILTDIKMAFFSGLALSLPILFYEIGRFVLPGLIEKERRLFISSLIFSSLSFYIGVAFAYFVAIPFAIPFLVSYGQHKGVLPQISIAMYVDFNLKFLLAFGVIFEFPVLMVLLSKTGLLTVPFLVHTRKYAVIAAFFIAAILTPTPDIFNQFLMALPLIVLYEMGIVAVRFFGRSQTQTKTEEERHPSKV